MRIEVRCPNCRKDHDERKVEFLNIEEDIQGRDVLMFVCPACGSEVKSLRASR